MQCPGCGGDVRLIAFTRLTEREILEHLSRGYSNREIADTFAISVPTVRSHLRSIYAKLHARSRTQAALKIRDPVGRRWCFDDSPLHGSVTG
jgi:DNA-binding CsgD family transcriptional regulator